MAVIIIDTPLLNDVRVIKYKQLSSILENCHRNGRNVRTSVCYVFYGPKIYKIKFAKKKMAYPKFFVDIQIC